MSVLNIEDIEDFTLGIEHGAFMWKVKLKELIFTDEVKKRFYSFRRPYLISGI